MESKNGEKVFDPVNKAKHYNTHPSGIEAIRIVEGMSFCIGSAFKYVFRREGKETVRSLKSSLYYLNRQMNTRNQVVLDWRSIYLILDVAEKEENETARDFYQNVYQFCRSLDDKFLKKAIEAVEKLIKEAETHEA